eukprot:1724323-Rhodomonas_salina.4
MDENQPSGDHWTWERTLSVAYSPLPRQVLSHYAHRYPAGVGSRPGLVPEHDACHEVNGLVHVTPHNVIPHTYR